VPSKMLPNARNRWTRPLLCLLIGTAGIVPAQTRENDAAENAALRAEVRKLSGDLLQLRADFVQWKMQSLGAELLRVQAERLRLTAERQLIEREIGDLSQVSADGPGGEDEGRREELKTAQLPAVWERERAAVAREAALGDALGAESERLAAIQKQKQRLESQAPGRD